MTPIGFLVSNVGLLDDLTEQLYASFGYESHANIQLISCLVKELFNRNKLSLFHHPEKLFSCKFSEKSFSLKSCVLAEERPHVFHFLLKLGGRLLKLGRRF